MGDAAESINPRIREALENKNITLGELMSLLEV
jgi:hypothetical protein